MVARWKRPSSVAHTTTVSNPGSTCNHSRSYSGINKVLTIVGGDFISTRIKKDGRDRDISEAVDKRRASPSGDHGLCLRLAIARHDIHVINPIQPVAAFIKETKARHRDRAADSKCVTESRILVDGESGAARNAESNRAPAYQVQDGQQYDERDGEDTPKCSIRVDFHWDDSSAIQEAGKAVKVATE